MHVPDSTPKVTLKHVPKVLKPWIFVTKFVSFLFVIYINLNRLREARETIQAWRIGQKGIIVKMNNRNNREIYQCFIQFVSNFTMKAWSHIYELRVKS